MPDSPPHPLAPPVVEIERRIRWPAPAAIAFLGFVAVLLVMAVLPVILPPRVLEGLPDDPDARAAAALVQGMDPAPRSGLAFASALFGTETTALPEPPANAGIAGVRREVAIAGAREHLERARRRLGGEPRLRVFLAHLELAEATDAADAGDGRGALRLLRRAERHYRAVADGRTEVPEARMGLGVLLAVRGAREPDPERRRGRRLMAIAQFAAVRDTERMYPTALFDRALLLSQVDRLPEARERAREYLARDAASPRASRLREEIERAGR